LNCVSRLSSSTKSLYTTIRKIFPKFIEDTPKYKDIEKIKTHFENTDPIVSSK